MSRRPISGKLLEVNDRSTVTKTGLEAPGQHSEHELGDGHDFALQDRVRILLVALVAALVWFRVWEPFARVSIVGVAGSADRDLRRRGLHYDDALLPKWIDDSDIE